MTLRFFWTYSSKCCLFYAYHSFSAKPFMCVLLWASTYKLLLGFETVANGRMKNVKIFFKWPIEQNGVTFGTPGSSGTNIFLRKYNFHSICFFHTCYFSYQTFYTTFPWQTHKSDVLELEFWNLKLKKWQEIEILHCGQWRNRENCRYLILMKMRYLADIFLYALGSE